MTSTPRLLPLVLGALFIASEASAGVNRWTTNGPWGGPVVSAARDPSSPNLFYAGTEQGLYLSRNGGLSWSLAAARGQSVSAIGISLRAPVSVYAFTSPGILWRSSDSGRTWRESTPFGEDAPTSLVVDILGVVYAGAITAGCGGGNYCPALPVTREQMAVFLLRTHGGPAYLPPACTAPIYADVPCGSPYAAWINELAVRGITGGCGGGNYCPLGAVTRGQMAVFLSLTFALP